MEQAGSHYSDMPTALFPRTGYSRLLLAHSCKGTTPLLLGGLLCARFVASRPQGSGCQGVLHMRGLQADGMGGTLTLYMRGCVNMGSSISLCP